MKIAIKTISDFLEKPLTDLQINELEKYLDFENFQTNKSVNMSLFKELKVIKSEEQGFIRKGKVNGSSDEFTPDIAKRMEKWIEDGYLLINDPDFKYPNFVKKSDNSRKV